MEWPKELLEIFDDPLLDGVRPRAATPTADVNEWIAKHGREPRNEGDLKEKMMYAAMTSLRKKGFDVWI